MALRVTTPLRRLTDASRALAEGQLGERISHADIRAGSSEIAALATQFNAMVDQVEESVERIRRDRDRSRDFLADVSHELRTPIAALLTFNELLTERAGDDPGARAEFLDNSRVQLERLDWLAQNLLELSKLDCGLVLLDLRPDDLRVAVESAVEQAGPAARRRDVGLGWRSRRRRSASATIPQRIGQVVTNLVGNAIKFTRAGRPRRRPGRADRGRGDRIEVADTGVGIEPAELPRMFERFYRGSRANEARGSGSGLGLAIVRSIVDMHRGAVEVSSRLGIGTTFTVSLPNDPRRAQPGDAEQPSAGARSAGSRPIDGEADPGKMVGFFTDRPAEPQRREVRLRSFTDAPSSCRRAVGSDRHMRSRPAHDRQLHRPSRRDAAARRQRLSLGSRLPVDRCHRRSRRRTRRLPSPEATGPRPAGASPRRRPSAGSSRRRP